MKSLSVKDVVAKVKGKKVGVFVAHPDDETMWAGGLIAALDSPSVYACSIPVRDPVRAEKFLNACEVLGASGHVMPFEETPGAELPHLETMDWVMGLFDVIVTHNASGEYGHLHHIQVHVWAILNRQHRDILTFGYGEVEGYPLPDKLAAKKDLALKCYNHKSPTDGGLTKDEALRKVYGDRFDLFSEGYMYA